MLAEASCQHVGENARHDGRSEHIVKSLEPAFNEPAVNIVKKVIDVLHSDNEIFDEKLERKKRVLVEFGFVDMISLNRHLGCARIIAKFRSCWKALTSCRSSGKDLFSE